jgi:hypothetical protein
MHHDGTGLTPPARRLAHWPPRWGMRSCVRIDRALLSCIRSKGRIILKLAAGSPSPTLRLTRQPAGSQGLAIGIFAGVFRLSYCAGYHWRTMLRGLQRLPRGRLHGRNRRATTCPLAAWICTWCSGSHSALYRWRLLAFPHPLRAWLSLALCAFLRSVSIPPYPVPRPLRAREPALGTGAN